MLRCSISGSDEQQETHEATNVIHVHDGLMTWLEGIATAIALYSITRLQNVIMIILSSITYCCHNIVMWSYLLNTKVLNYKVFSFIHNNLISQLIIT